MLIDTIYCFYADLGWPEHAALVPFWEERWQKAGWKTKVLGQSDAAKDPRYGQMLKKAESVPCINPRPYEQANFIRWLAFSSIAGAVTDFDVFPIREFKPMEIEGFISGDSQGGPGFIAGPSSGFSKIADDILSYVPDADDISLGMPHVSDMVILYRTKARFDAILNNVGCYGFEGWKTYPLCHFCNNALAHINGAKKDKIQRILDTECVF